MAPSRSPQRHVRRCPEAVLADDAERDHRCGIGAPVMRAAQPGRAGALALMLLLAAVPAAAADRDGDGLRDGFETKWGLTSPDDRDSDNDGVVDSAEDHDHDDLGDLGSSVLVRTPPGGTATVMAGRTAARTTTATVRATRRSRTSARSRPDYDHVCPSPTKTCNHSRGSARRSMVSRGSRAVHSARPTARPRWCWPAIPTP